MIDREAKMKRARQLMEQQALRDKHDASIRWIICALIAGLCCGLANYWMGIKLAHTGMMGPGYTGPAGLVILVIYRLW